MAAQEFRNLKAKDGLGLGWLTISEVQDQSVAVRSTFYRENATSERLSNVAGVTELRHGIAGILTRTV